MSGEEVAAGPRQGAAAGEDGGDQPEAVEAVEAGDATGASDDACTNSADQREHGDGASLLHEGGRAALDGEVIPPAPAGLFDEVIALNDELAAGLRSTVETAVRLGQALIRAKERCPHGTWLPTLERCTRIKARSASSYMKLAKAWPMWSAKHRQQIADLGLVAALADLWQAIASRRRESDKGALERLNELKSLDHRSGRRLELLDAHIAAQEHFLVGLRDLHERVRLEVAEAGP